LWTFGGHNNIREIKHHWGLKGLLWTAASGTWESTSEDLTWTTHTDTLVRKGKQRLNQLRQLSKFRVSQRILQTFYAGAV